MTNGSLMQVKSIAECSPLSILQYFWPALSNNWSWKPIFGLFESGCFTQVLLYVWNWHSRDLTFVSAAENSLSTEVYVSDDDESFSSPTPQTVYTSQTQAGDTKME